MFELLARDGLARIGRIETPHGTFETPALLPVVHPDPSLQGIPPLEMRDSWGVKAIISSSYILYRNAELREKARKVGLHELLGFPGTIMTDSGAFQQHVYGGVDVTPEEILGFQNEIGTDIATLLDHFIEPGGSHEDAQEGVDDTLKRAEDARAKRGDRLLAVPVQGGLFPELRKRSAVGSSPLADVLCMGGIVPLMETYRFADLGRMLAEVHPHLAPEKPLHLFGLGHPMLFAFGALLGGDLFDTSSYHKFAKRGALLFPEGSIQLSSIREEICGCSLCARTPLTKVAELPATERALHLSRHNLQQCLLEIARVKQAIKEGELWELVERRATGHPALLAALREITIDTEVFLPYEPPSRKSFPIIGEISMRRPAADRFRRALERYVKGRERRRMVAPHRLTLKGLSAVPAQLSEDPKDTTIWEVETPFGLVPAELLEVYPLGCLLTPEEFAVERTDESGNPASMIEPETEEELFREQVAAYEHTTSHKTADKWAMRHALGIIEWCWGRAAREALTLKPIGLRHSLSSGRLREVLLYGKVLFVVGNDGLPHPTLAGGEVLHASVPSPSLRVVANEDAAPFARRGKSLFSKYVSSVDPAVAPDQYVLVVDSSDTFLGVGRTIMAANEMGRFSRGVAVRMIAHRTD
jgi:7-cyano-7-deazaguanine tRNA-ribosyltransferase